MPPGNRHESEEKSCQLKGTESELSSNYFGLESRNQIRRTSLEENCFKREQGLHNKKALSSIPKNGGIH